MKKKQKESIRVFKSDFLEKFTHVHPITPLVMWVPFIGWLIWRSFAIHSIPVTTFALLGFMGFFVWTLSEYVLHRYVFHIPKTSPLKERIYFIIHGLHHDDPNDATRLVMPPVPAIVLAISLYYIFRPFLGAVHVEPFFAFFLIGYLCYDYTHYAIHHFTPRTRFGKYVKYHHMQHHFVTPNARWGVSSPVWDYVFGTLDSTAPQKKQNSAV